VQEDVVSHRDAKAAAKAAKAYAKAQRPWYKKKRFIAPAGVVAVIAAIAISTAGGSDASVTPRTEAPAASAARDGGSASAASASASAGVSAAALPIQDGDWRLDSIRVDDSLGDFGGTARITYTGADGDGGSNIFTVTVFAKGTDVAAMVGSVNSVMPGDTATVQLISTDRFVAGPYRYDFQNDL
jgi:hypothetical protein